MNSKNNKSMRLTDSTIIGIDIGGTKTKIAYYFRNKLNIIFNRPTPKNPAEFTKLIVKEIKNYKFPSEIVGIGIGCPGPLDPKTGTVLSPPNLKQWVRFSLTKILGKELKIPTILENDANAGALGESLFGSGIKHKNVLYLTISTGLGCGIVINKQIHQGYKGLAGEVWAFGPEMFGVNKYNDNLNDLASGNGMVLQAKKCITKGEQTVLKNVDITTHNILEAYSKNDDVATKILNTARSMIVSTLCFSLYLLSPDIVVLGGGLCTDPRWFVNPVIKRVRKMVAIKELRNIPIRRAQLSDSAVLYGAIGLVINGTKN